MRMVPFDIDNILYHIFSGLASPARGICAVLFLCAGVRCNGGCGGEALDKSAGSGIIRVEKIFDSKGENGILKLSSKFISPHDPLYANADKIKPIDGFSDIICHGSPYELLINGLKGEEWSYNAKEAAEMIRNSNEFSGKSIRLISCGTGGGENSIAQMISNELGVDVLAPTEDVYVNAEGDMFLTNNKTLAYMWNEGEDVRETGKWIVFKPKKE